MEPRKLHLLQYSMHPPAKRDRVIVLLMSLGVFLLLLPEALLIHTQATGIQLSTKENVIHNKHHSVR
jgi:hypothetical protein